MNAKTSTAPRPTVSTLAFQLTAQAVVGHLLSNSPTRAAEILEHMTSEHLDALEHVAGTVVDLARAAREGKST